MEDSVFTKIIKGELPSYKVYEDDLTIAIVPLYPISICHIVVIPKKQVVNFYDLDEPDYQALMSTVKKISRRVKEVIKSEKVGLKVVGLGVDHAHVHVIAFDTLDQFNENEESSGPVNTKLREEIAQKLAF